MHLFNACFNYYYYYISIILKDKTDNLHFSPHTCELPSKVPRSKMKGFLQEPTVGQTSVETRVGI